MNNYTKILKRLELLKQHLKSDEEHIISTKNEIAALEKIVGEGQASELEKEFVATKEKINDDSITLIGDIERDLLNIGRAKICEGIEAISEKTGIPVYTWSSAFDLNSWYVPTTVSKWKDLNFKDFEIKANTNVTGWQHSSAC